MLLRSPHWRCADSPSGCARASRWQDRVAFLGRIVARGLGWALLGLAFPTILCAQNFPITQSSSDPAEFGEEMAPLREPDAAPAYPPRRPRLSIAVARPPVPPRKLTPIQGSQELLQEFGVEESYLALIVDGIPYTEDESEALFKMLYAVRRFAPVQIQRWREPNLDLSLLKTMPKEQRGKIYPFYGRIETIEEVKTTSEIALRFELEGYYRCEAVLENGQRATVFSLEVPEPWLTQTRLPGEWRTSGRGFFFKWADEQPIFVCASLAWHPQGLLGDLGMDMSLFHKVKNSTPLTAQDSECFYSLLATTRKRDPNKLAGLTRIASDGPQFHKSHIRDWLVFPWKLKVSASDGKLSPARQIWNTLSDPLKEQLRSLPLDALPSAELQQLLLDELNQALLRRELYEPEAWATILSSEKGRGVLARDEQLLVNRGPAQLTDVELQRFNRLLLEEAFPDEIARTRPYSVIPLFNNPGNQHGRLLRIEGTARRAVKIVVEDPDLVERWGFKEYYELEVFTNDSQSNPIVLCVLELPKGMPRGEVIHERVIFIGFFFKTWAYQVETPLESGSSAPLPSGETTSRSVRRLAPMLLGSRVVWAPLEPEPINPYYGMVAGGLFVIVLLGICVWVWQCGKEDKAFHQQTIAKHFEPDNGVSLNEVGLVTQPEVHYRDHGQSPAETPTAPANDTPPPQT